MTTLEDPYASSAPPYVSEEVRKGQSIYTPLNLRIYDLWVLGFSNTLLWRCRTSRILALRSAAMNYLLHCLPGRMAQKAEAIDHVKQGVASGGRIFGATLLGRGVSLSEPARRLMELYNRKGIFCNREDDLPSLDQALRSRFERYDIELVGCAALFVAHC